MGLVIRYVRRIKPFILVGICIYMIAFGLLIRYRGSSVADHAGMIGGQGEFETRPFFVLLSWSLTSSLPLFSSQSSSESLEECSRTQLRLSSRPPRSIRVSPREDGASWKTRRALAEPALVSSQTSLSLLRSTSPLTPSDLLLETPSPARSGLRSFLENFSPNSETLHSSPKVSLDLDSSRNPS